MKTNELRKKFLNYFESKGHKIAPSSPVVPLDDPTLLFVNAGMNQFKKVFLGHTDLGYKTAATSQKCIRVGGKHNDLDNVGHTARHCTFFEMLGNFSFGDYFKEKAVEYAWEFATNHLQVPVEKLFVTVYHEDLETFELWKKHLPESRITKIATNDNFWSMGDVGPCGPCTELFLDKGPSFSNATNPGNDTSGERFLEFWNLVFMQFNRDEKGVLHPLPKPCVDTGMGMERMLSLLSHKETVFETDVLRSLIQTTEELSHVKYESNKSAFNVVADHLRTLSFAIADGVQPSNLDRGYVLRKVLRRAVRYGKQLGLNDPFLGKVFPTLLKEMGSDYPELETAKEKIVEILSIEEENFFRTLKRGGNILNSILEEAKNSSVKQISGEDAFKLKDTYGFPLEEILLLAKDSHVEVNLESYMLLEEAAKETSRKAHTKHSQVAEENVFAVFAEKHEPTEFVGYEELESHSTILGIVKEGQFVDKLEEGEEAAIILDKTPFYAEMGGQQGDSGQILHHSANFKVDQTASPFPGVTLHRGILRSGTLLLGEPVHGSVDEKKRRFIARNHTATHLLHWALEAVLGPHIRQAGSLVEPNRIRFDFSHHKPLSPAEIREVEVLINEKIRGNGPVYTNEVSYEAVKGRGDVKQFFGDKYGATVRVVNIDEFSKELCGGTHVEALSEIGLFRIVKETSIAAGMRRVEAATGSEAEMFMYAKEDLLQSLAEKLQASESQATAKLDALFEEKSTLKELLKKMRIAHLKDLSKKLLEEKEVINKIPVIATRVELFKEEFATLGNDLINALGSGIILLAMEEEDKCQLLIKVSTDLIEKGFKAGDLIREIAAIVGGKGGGKADTAQAGGKDKEHLDAAFLKLKELVKK